MKAFILKLPLIYVRFIFKFPFNDGFQRFTLDLRSIHVQLLLDLILKSSPKICFVERCFKKGKHKKSIVEYSASLIFASFESPNVIFTIFSLQKFIWI